MRRRHSSCSIKTCYGKTIEFLVGKIIINFLPGLRDVLTYARNKLTFTKRRLTIKNISLQSHSRLFIRTPIKSYSCFESLCLNTSENSLNANKALLVRDDKHFSVLSYLDGLPSPSVSVPFPSHSLKFDCFRHGLSFIWLDIANPYGSIPHFFVLER